MKPICAKNSEVRGFVFSFLASIIIYILAMLVIDYFTGVDITVDTIHLFHSYFGVFMGYTEVDYAVVYSILFSIGIVIGASNTSIVSSIGSLILFFAIHFILFFGIGLLGLGHHYDYENVLFQNYIVTLIIPIVIMSIGIVIGLMVIKKPNSDLVYVSRY